MTLIKYPKAPRRDSSFDDVDRYQLDLNGPLSSVVPKETISEVNEQVSPGGHRLSVSLSHAIPYPVPMKFKPAEFSKYSWSPKTAKTCTHEIFYGYDMLNCVQKRAWLIAVAAIVPKIHLFEGDLEKLRTYDVKNEICRMYNPFVLYLCT